MLELNIGEIYLVELFATCQQIVEIVDIMPNLRYEYLCLLPRMQACGVDAEWYTKINKYNMPLYKQLQHKIYQLEYSEFKCKINKSW